MTVRRLIDLEGEALVRAAELLDRASHDVAKYMSITARNIDPRTAGADDIVRVLHDLTRTDGRRPAWELWSEVSAPLHELADDPELRGIDAAMTRAALAAGAGTGIDGVPGLVGATLDAADRIVRLRRAVLARRMEVER